MHHGRDQRQRRDHGSVHRVDSHRLRDALDAVLASVLEDVRELVADPIAHHPRDADAAMLRKGYQARSDIDAVAVDVAPVADYVADIDPHPELDAAIGG